MFFAISDLLAPNLLAVCYLPFPKNARLCADLCYNLKDGEIFRPQHFKTHFFFTKEITQCESVLPASSSSFVLVASFLLSVFLAFS